MADYNSVYTGIQVDAAIAKTDAMLGFEEVYQGSPTNTGIPLSSLSVNPGTGDKTGIYDVLYSGSTTDPDSSSGTGSLSRLYIGNEAGTYNGAGTSSMTDTDLYTHHVVYNDSNSGLLEAVIDSHAFGSGTAGSSKLYIHKIWRLQTTA